MSPAPRTASAPDWSQGSASSVNDPDVVVAAGDIAEIATAERVLSAALDRFGRIDTLVNNAGVFIAKPFTDYTPDDYARATAANLAGFDVPPLLWRSTEKP